MENTGIDYGNGLTNIDLKTGNNIWPEHHTQVSAYRHILLENGHQVDRVRILNIPRHETESFQEVILSESVLNLNWMLFANLLKVYDLRKQLNKG